MLNYVELLLEKVDRKFVTSFKAELKSNPNSDRFDFTSSFEKLYDQAETEAKNAPKMSKSRQEIDLKKEKAAGQKNAAKRAEEAREAAREAMADVAGDGASNPDSVMKKKLDALKKKKGGDVMARKGSKGGVREPPEHLLPVWCGVVCCGCVDGGAVSSSLLTPSLPPSLPPSLIPSLPALDVPDQGEAWKGTPYMGRRQNRRCQHRV